MRQPPPPPLGTADMILSSASNGSSSSAYPSPSSSDSLRRDSLGGGNAPTSNGSLPPVKKYRELLPSFDLDKLVAPGRNAGGVEGLADLVTATAEMNRRVGTHDAGDARSMFECVSIPPISIGQFAKRLGELKFHSEIWYHTAVLIDRSCVVGDMPLTPWNSHRVLLSCLLVALKALDTPVVDGDLNAELSRLGGVSPLDLNEMEATLLNLIEFNTLITQQHVLRASKYIRKPRPQYRRIHTSQISPNCCWAALFPPPKARDVARPVPPAVEPVMKRRLHEARKFSSGQ
eukprot:TRINITY_DN847_c3_g2_i2.p1 TRINITY_DN847_c3_g2~~TRINITY_DN847_c3_g2_i2.p1  ORF type:complete len:289 (+),score=45.40 TRINITY_DN847_c3_g2_i2:150-1016(+)